MMDIADSVLEDVRDIWERMVPATAPPWASKSFFYFVEWKCDVPDEGTAKQNILAVVNFYSILFLSVSSLIFMLIGV